MLYFRCSECRSGYALTEDDPDIRSLSPMMGCVHAPVCTGVLKATDLAPLNVKLISAKELFQSVEGGGVPTERRCGPDAVLKAVSGKRIVGLAITPAGSDKNRSIIQSIKMEDGTLLILAASVLGATVSKITREDDGVPNPG